ncbi:MAG TPA: nickel ABC transporter permease [Acidimicrobiales bacterium]|jgi:peptide/nickel transport system permease protein|nr:nickel ABC transporter permease [Acidimicrobiales bacterium]
MRRFVLRRVLLMIPTLFGISLLTFGLANATPGDPAFVAATRALGRPPSTRELAAERKELGLDRPLFSQYVRWVTKAARGDLGISFADRRPVRDELFHRIPFTLQLALPAMALALLVAIPAGMISALRRNRPVDQVVRVVSLAGACMPSFWLALLLIILFSVRLSLLPVAGRGGLNHLVLPVVTLAMVPMSILARYTRSTMLEALSSDYVTTARAKGAAEWRVVSRHVLRNSLVPIITSVGTQLGFLLAGATVIETIFVWPGVGKLLVDAITARDYPMIEGFVLYAGVAFVVLNLVIDVLYAAIDPRIVTGGSAR